MTVYSVLFYLLAVIIVTSTALAITRRNLVHAILYLVFSFVGSAMLFFLLGAPLLALFQVIIYAGAIMILFLFIVMMVRLDAPAEAMFPFSQWLPAALFGLIYIGIGAAVAFTTPGSEINLQMAMALPKDFGRYVVERHWLSIEIISLLLLVALIGALYLGKTEQIEEIEEEL
jgi:NADH-quinone oxidoreductase subunit J